MNEEMKKLKCLIISAAPYCGFKQSRIFDTYFELFKKEQLIQLCNAENISYEQKCSSYFCLSDKMMLKSAFKPNKKELGNIIEFRTDESYNRESNVTSWVRRLLSKKTSIRYFLRQLLWGNKRWKNQKLLNWVKTNNPSFIFLSVTDDFYLNNIAIWLSTTFQIPLFINIVDDYFFSRPSRTLFFNLYKIFYKKHFKRLINQSVGQVYISEKIKEKYDSFFNKNGVFIQIKSQLEPLFFCKEKQIKNIVYSGTLNPGRWRSVISFSNALKKQKINCLISVYTFDLPGYIFKRLSRCKNIVMKEPIPYEKLLNVIKNADCLLIVESFRKKDIELTRFSFSTKTSDSICSGRPIIAYGPKESGCIGYLSENEIGTVFTNKKIESNGIGDALFIDKNKASLIYSKSQAYKEKEDARSFLNYVFDTLVTV